MPTLRLVNTAGDSAAAALSSGDAPDRHAAWRIATENHAASQLSATDGRWVFAVQVARNLSGGAAASLSPDRRAKLMCTARNLGLRPFDASLIIAVVQEGTRTGEGLSRELEERLNMLPAPVRGSAAIGLGPLLLAFALGLAGFGALVMWLGV